MEPKSVTLPSEDEDEDCMPKIINTISLQGYSEVEFNEEPNNEDFHNVLHPECEIKGESRANEDIKTEPIENGFTPSSVDKEETVKKEKKRVTLTHLSHIKQEREPKVKPSTSRREAVVDAKRLALQESLFKTKELFDTFLRVCQDNENTEQMERVVQKLGRAYDAAKQEFLGSPAFQNILEAETEKVNTSNVKPWLNMKLVLDELKHNKKSAGSKLKLGESEESQDAGGSNDDEPVIECPKKRRHLKKLEKVLRAINLKIKKLEEREVDWEEEDNSAYCKLDRYRAQFTKIYTKICEIRGKLPDADRPYLRKVSFAGTTYPHINRCIEKYYNKHREFPDFQDIKKLVILALKQEGIEMPPVKIHSMAQSAFKEFGEMLKRLRQYDDYDILISYLDQQVDPARDDEQLQEQLTKNALLFKKREQEVIDKFVEKETAKDFGSVSEEDSDSKPKKKKRRIIITDPYSKKTPSSASSKNLSSGESSDEEKDRHKLNTGAGLSSDSDSESDSEVHVKQSVTGKGKALIGKKRIVKKGVEKRASSNISQLPKTAISSDEESAPGNTKESLTNYLGLKGMNTSKSNPTKESNRILDSDDEGPSTKITKKPPKTQHRTRVALSDDSDSDKATKTISAERKTKLDSSNSNKNVQDSQSKINAITDSDSDIEPIKVIKKPKPSPKSNVKKTKNQARKSTAPRTHKSVPKKHVVETSQNNTHERISDSDNESRTSVESESDRRKSLSDVELSPDVITDVSDDERKKNVNNNVEEPIVILSEDVIEEPKPSAPTKSQNKPLEDSSDSDDICILSQVEAERRTVAPRKMKPNNTAVLSGNTLRKVANSVAVSPVRTLGRTATSSSLRKPGNATSTPVKNTKPLLKRRLSNLSNSSGSSGKARKTIVGFTTNGRGKQTTLPQVINGAARKVLISRVAKSSSSSRASTPDSAIPLIELD